MSSMAISPLFFFMFLVLQSTTNAYNITEILSPFKQFSDYNSFLTETGVANEINSLKAVTVLVLSNDQCYYFNHIPGDVTKRKLSFHVIPDYFDESKLKSLKSGTRLATLDQGATMTVDHDSSGSVTFRSAGSDPNTGVKLLSTVKSQPHSISVLQIATSVEMDKRAPPPSRTPPKQPRPVLRTGSIASPPRKVLEPPPPPTSRDKSSPTPKASPNRPRHEPPPASSLTPKVNNNAPPPSKTKSINITLPSQTLSESNSTSQGTYASSPSKSIGQLASTYNGSPVSLPLKPTSTAATAAAAAAANNVQAPGSDQKSSAHARICSGNYLGSILVVFTTVWFIFTMNW